MDKPTRGRMEWRRAFRALGKLVEDPERTDQVFELIQALTGNSIVRGFRKFAALPGGKRLLAEGADIVAVLADRERLSALPEGTLGHAYVRFMGGEELSAQGLREAHEQVRDPQDPEIDEALVYFAERMRDQHDLWHVVNGYGRDEAGEAALLAFTLAQTGNPGIGLIVLTAAWIGPWSGGLAWQRYLFQAFRRGWKTPRLSVVYWEELMEKPLAEVRRELAIPPAPEAHPGGIWVFEKATETYHRQEVPA